MTAQTLANPSTRTNADSGDTRVLIADAFDESGIDMLKDAGCDVHVDPSLSGDALAETVRSLQPQALVVRSTKVPEPVIAAGDQLGLIVRAGAGYDTIDVAAASARGIAVANCPGMNSIAVAELAWGLILSCDRRIPDQSAELREGTWNKKEYARASGLHGRTLGVIGLGKIGREVASRGEAFGMKVVAWSRSLTESHANAIGVGYCEDLLNLVRMSDVITIHVAATTDTKHMVNADFCEAMKPGAILVNTTRGSIVDESALSDAIESKGIRAGLDVYANEPGSGEKVFSDPIVNLPGVYGTHHVGASTTQAQEAIAGEAVRVLRHWMDAGEVLNCVNMATATAASTILTVRHLNRPGVLAHVFEVLGRSAQNVEEMENVIYEGGEAAVAMIQVDGAISPEDLTLITQHEHVLGTSTASIRSR